MTFRLLFVLSSQVLLFLTLVGKEANWPRHEIFSGSHVNSATAHDYDKDGDQEILFSADSKVFLYLGPDYEKKQLLAHAGPRYAKLKGRCIHSVLHDVDSDGDLDFVGSFVRGLFWLECPDKNPTSSEWKMHQITDEIFGVHCIRSFDIDRDGKNDLIANDFTDDKGPYSRSVCWLKPKLSKKKAIEWTIIPLAKGTAQGGSHYFDFGDVNGDGRWTLPWEPRANSLKTAITLRSALFRGRISPSPWRPGMLPGCSASTSSYPYAGRPADANGDGKIDILPPEVMEWGPLVRSPGLETAYD